MRNLKKILALVLALVMVVGMMTVASAATPGTAYVDDANITKYDEAVQVLTGLGIYEGDETAAFNPNNTITRAEVATLVYRVVTGDTTGKYVGIYADYDQFADVASNEWYAGYVNFCANGGYLKGDGTNFYPMEKVTGYQVLAIMLRVIGYGMEGEYEGTNWHIRTASKAAELGITKNITSGTLGAYSTRAMVAEMIYRSIAQTSVVTYNRRDLYTKIDTTYAYQNFGLYGTGNTTYAGLTERAKAERDSKYGEPAAQWNIKGGDPIVIRFNPVKTYTVATKDEVMYADAGLAGTSTPVYNYAIDGVTVATPVTLYKAASNGTTPAFGGKGVETILFVADGRVFVVEKNTFVDFAGYKLDGTHYDLVPFWADRVSVQVDDCTADLVATIAYGAPIIFNMYSGVVDASTIHAAKAQNVVVTNTYDTGASASSYFLAGTKYEYNDIYATNTGWNYLPQTILNRDEHSVDVQLDWTTGVVTDAFSANQTIYFDDYGYVIFTHDTMSATNTKGYVFVRSAVYGGQIADNRWVSNYTVIMPDGTAATIKGATNEYGYWNTQYDASDADYTLGLYSYEIVNGYYALRKVDTTDWSHIVTNTVDYVTGLTQIMAGEAGAIANGANAVVDDNTSFIIANYDASGAISGYTVIKGFKNIPDLKGTLTVEYVRNDDTISLVLVLGAKQSANIAGNASTDTYIYLADTTPLDFVVTYDTHKVIANGVAGTMNFVPNTVNNNGTVVYGTGFYKVTGTQNELVSSMVAQTTTNLTWRASSVLVDGSGNLVTVADNCVYYNISGSSVAAVTAADVEDYLNGESCLIAAKDAYGYATVIYILGLN